MKCNNENRVVIKDSKVVTLLNDETRRTGLLDLEEARRLSHEQIKMHWKLRQYNEKENFNY